MAVTVGPRVSQHIGFPFKKSHPNMRTIESSNSVNFYNTDVPDFGTFLLSETFADVFLICGENKIAAHRSRLSAVSPFLAALFAKDTTDTSVIIIPDVKYETLRVLIHFIYTGFIRATEAEVFDLLEAGRLLGVEKSIDVEKVDFGTPQVTAVRNARKRHAPPSPALASLQKKKKTAAKTVVIFDTFENSSMQLPSGLSDPISDPLDVTDVCSTKVVVLQDDPNTEPDDPQVMKASPAVPGSSVQSVSSRRKAMVVTGDTTLPKPTQDKTHPNVPAASSQEPATGSTTSQNAGAQSQEMECAVAEVTKHKECDGDQQKQFAKRSEETEHPKTPTSKNVDDSGQRSDGPPDSTFSSCMSEFQTFLKKITPPKQSEEQNKTSGNIPVVPMASLDSDSGADNSPPPSPVTSLVNSNKEESMECDVQETNKEPTSKKGQSSPERARNESKSASGRNPETQLSVDMQITKPTSSEEMAAVKDTVSSDPTSLVQHKDKIQLHNILTTSEPVDNTSTSNTMEQQKTISLSPKEQNMEKTIEISGKSTVLDTEPISNVEKSEAEKSSVQEKTSMPQEALSPKPGLSKTVQQAVAGLLMWKSSKQKQSSKSNEQAEAIVTTAATERRIEQRITVLTPRIQERDSISNANQKIIEEELSKQLQCAQKDPLSMDEPESASTSEVETNPMLQDKQNK